MIHVMEHQREKSMTIANERAISLGLQTTWQDFTTYLGDISLSLGESSWGAV